MKNDKTDTLLMLGTLACAIATALLGSARERRNTEKSVRKNLLEMAKEEDKE